VKTPDRRGCRPGDLGGPPSSRPAVGRLGVPDGKGALATVRLGLRRGMAPARTPDAPAAAIRVRYHL